MRRLFQNLEDRLQAARTLLLGMVALSLAPITTWAITPETAKGTGLYGEYFGTKELEGSIKLRRTDRQINFSWGMQSPYASVPVDGFSVRWSGEVEAPVSGDYTFATAADDGVRLWVNGRKIIDDWETHPVTVRRAAAVKLTAGQHYSIRLEYFDNGGAAAVRLLWAYTGQAEQVIPQARLYVPGPVDYLSDLPAVRSTNLELDKSNGKGLMIGGVGFAKGLGVRAESEVVYKLGRLYDDFRATVGIDDGVPPDKGSVVFEVWVDGMLKWDSAMKRGNMAGQYVHVDVTGRDELRLVVKNGGDGGDSDWADWADAHVILQNGGARPAPAPDPDPYLSELAWKSATSGWGPPERDRSNGEKLAADGKEISIAGRKFAFGLGVHASSEIVYSLDKEFLRFVADVGVDDEVGAGRGSVVFQVFGDGVKLFETVKMAQGMAARRIDLNIAGVTLLKLVVTDAGDGIGYDHADWGGARVYRTTGGTPPPTTAPGAPGTLTAVGGNAKVTLNWGAATGAASYNVYRGTAAGAEAATPVAMGIGGTSYTDSAVVNGTAYFYKVSGVNAGGIGARSNEATATPQVPLALPGAPGTLTAAAGNGKVTLTWGTATGAASYNVYRGPAAGQEAATPVASGITVLTYTDTTVVNWTAYFYRVAGVNATGAGARSNEANAKPDAAPGAPATLTATPGNARVTLAWGAATGAATYQVFRGTTAGGEAGTPLASGITALTYADTSAVNGTTYFYKVAGVNTGGLGAPSPEASGRPDAPPVAPLSLTATGGDLLVTLNWPAVSGAASYNVYRGTASGGQAATPVATGLTTPTFTNTGLVNGTTYFFKVAGVSAGGVGARSAEASATPATPPAPVPPSDQALWRLLRQATWGPTQADFAHLKAIGVDAWIDEQFAATPSVYPDSLLTQNMEWTEEYFYQLALTGNDQLRQRVAWALSQIWVVSGVELVRADAMVPYIRLLQDHALGNFFTLMKDATIHPAMGEYLDMVNNKKASGASMPNENFAREVLQLFTIGLTELNPDGTPRLNGLNQPFPTYGQDDVLELARVFTGWTYPDGVAGQPTKLNSPRYDGPMEAVEAFHDTGAKRFLNTDVAPGMTAAQDLDNALRIIFQHSNTGPFISRQLIQRLVTSNPSPAYIAAVAAVFADNGSGVRGDLKAVVKAILKHPEAQLTAPTAGKLAEPAVFITRQLRAIGGSVADYPFMSDLSTEMGQHVFHSPSVFNYYSPNFRITGTALTGPEFQLYTTATGMIRANFVASLVSGGFGSAVTLNLTPWTTLAADPGALLNQIDQVVFGGTMSPAMRGTMLTAINAAPNARERVMTAFYLAFTSSQFQVEH